MSEETDETIDNLKYRDWTKTPEGRKKLRELEPKRKSFRLSKEEFKAVMEALEERSRQFDNMLLALGSQYDISNKNLKSAIKKLKREI